MSVEVKYIETRGTWTLWIDGVYSHNVGAEMAGKVTFITGVQGQVTSMAGMADAMQNLFSVYWDRGYNPAGSDPITEADLVPFGIDIADFTACMTLFENFEKFLTNQAAAVADYDNTINKVRSDM